MTDSREHASLRKRALMEIYHHTGGDMRRQISCAELAEKLKRTTADAILIAEQLKGKTWIQLDPMTLQILMTIRGIEEAEKMERGRLRRFYEDHFALAGAAWTITVLLLSVALNKLADFLLKMVEKQ